MQPPVLHQLVLRLQLAVVRPRRGLGLGQGQALLQGGFQVHLQRLSDESPRFAQVFGQRDAAGHVRDEDVVGPMVPEDDRQVRDGMLCDRFRDACGLVPVLMAV